MQVEQAKFQGDTTATRRRDGVGVLVVDDEELTQWGFRLLLAGQPWAQRCVAEFVSRGWPARQLLGVIRTASAGTDPLPRAESGSLLSVRQQEILGLIADGATNTEIATRPFLSQHTVKQHTSALYRKLNVRNRTHAVQVARRHGILGT